MTDWAVKLFGKSIVKQVKYANVRRLLGDCQGKRCLDIGGDSGVISYLLRKGGGSWASADMGEEAIRSIRSLVDDDVHEISETKTPFDGGEFHTVAIVDMLEHVVPDADFLREMNRILKGDGALIVNVPLKKGWTPLGGIREACGLTDEEHGHVRPGYTLEELRALMTRNGFELQQRRYYHKSFTEAIDIMIRYAMKLLGKKGASQKGSIVTESDMRKHEKTFSLFSIAYPVLWCVSQLDRVLPFSKGYRLIVRGIKVNEV